MVIILDFGSGETCRNRRKNIASMINKLKLVDTGENTIVIKWQLFNNIPGLKPLSKNMFDYAFKYALDCGYVCTASVFDKQSLAFILEYDIPFVKIACRNQDYKLIELVPNEVPVVVSIPSIDTIAKIEKKNVDRDIQYLCCVRKYPAKPESYEHFNEFLHLGISDHTKDFELFHKYRPELYETHYKLEESIGLDNGVWAKTPDQLKEIL